MKRSKGFTIIEILVVIVVLCVGAWLFYSEKITSDAVRRDSARKQAINAMYYSLEEVYYEKNTSYPASIDSKTLRAMDPDFFTDPMGIKMGESSANYRYEPTGCNTDNRCTGYSLRSSMEREGDYVKTNRNTK